LSQWDKGRQDKGKPHLRSEEHPEQTPDRQRVRVLRADLEADSRDDVSG
jgi:hypothetical protein